MSRTYKATGINLKSMPLGEADRLLSILTVEWGLIRAVAPGARKPLSKMAGRSGLFVVNELLIAKGRSLDKITGAETIESYPKLSKDLGRLTASQYLAELVLSIALSEQPQAELFALLNEHLRRLEQSESSQVLAHLTQAVFHLLSLAGISPQVQACCVTQRPLSPNFNEDNWRVGFSTEAGGIISLSAPTETGTRPKLNRQLNATTLALLQQLAGADLPQIQAVLPPGFKTSEPLLMETAWVPIERILREYAQYHLGRSIRSAALMDACFAEPY